jgi:hypothetical protein
MEKQPKGPSIFWGALAGYGIGTAAGMLTTVVVAIGAGSASAVGALKLLWGFSGLGTFLGYQIALKRREKLGIATAKDRWQGFVFSGTCNLLVFFVIAGSFAFAVLIKLGFDLVTSWGR